MTAVLPFNETPCKQVRDSGWIKQVFRLCVHLISSGPQPFSEYTQAQEIEVSSQKWIAHFQDKQYACKKSGKTGLNEMLKLYIFFKANQIQSKLLD